MKVPAPSIHETPGFSSFSVDKMLAGQLEIGSDRVVDIARDVALVGCAGIGVHIVFESSRRIIRQRSHRVEKSQRVPAE